MANNVAVILKNGLSKVDGVKVQEILTLLGRVLSTAGYDQDIEVSIALAIYKAGLESVRGWTPVEVEIKEVTPHDGPEATGPPFQ